MDKGDVWHTLRALLPLADAHMILVSGLALIGTFVCRQANFIVDLPVDLVSIAVIFPVVFSISSAYTRREDALKSFAALKADAASLTDEQVLDYAVHDDGVSWTLVSSKQQRAQEGRYTLTPDGDSTNVHFELTVDPTIPVPGFLIKRGAKGLMETATHGLRKRVMKVKKSST